jgi:hypothetical protein
MKNFFKKISKLPWYPFLFSAYPVLALFGYNVEEARLVSVVRPLFVFLAGVLVVFLVLRVLLRTWHRAAFLTFMWTVLFATYGHLISYLEEKEIVLSSTVVVNAWLVLALVSLWLVYREKIKFSSATASLNLIALVLLAYPLYQIGSVTVQKYNISRISNVSASGQAVSQDNAGDLPDIYYIILDSYTRADLLQEAYGFDNTPFISKLEEMGFYVAECSQSNYMRTDISLTSTLNMDYVQNLSDKFKPDTYNRGQLFEMLKHNKVRKTLEAAGYETYAFETGFYWSEWDDAEVFMGPSPLSSDLTEFEELLLNTTLLRLLEEAGKINAYQISSNHYRERTGYVLDTLPELVKYPGPKFAFVHIISPHPPFVFGPDGEPTDSESFLNAEKKLPFKKYAIGYINQVTFLNSRMETILETLINDSDTPPVIILQGDHGPWMQPENKRLWILNAYYLPGQNAGLYSRISPVNSFRMVLNKYLDTSYGLLEDKSYFSPVPYIYDFKAYSNPCK